MKEGNISLISHFLTFEFFDMSLANCWKQTNIIDSNAVSKVFNRKRWTGQSFQKWRHLLIVWKDNIFMYVLDTWHSFFLLCVGGYGLLLAGCDLFYLGVVGLGECDLFWLDVAGCGRVWPSFGWVWMSVTVFWLGVGGCGWVWPFFDWCGWVWVSVGGCGWLHGL